MKEDRCEHQYDSDGERFAGFCTAEAIHAVEMSYRHGETKQVIRLCALHAKLDTALLNNWGRSYGHSARIIV